MYTHFVRAERLQARTVSTTPVVDTLCLLFLGTYHQHAALLRKASGRRDFALASLQHDLAGKRPGQRSDEMHGSMWISNFCNSYDIVANPPKLARTHMQAMGQLSHCSLRKDESSQIWDAFCYTMFALTESRSGHFAGIQRRQHCGDAAMCLASSRH